LYTEWALNYSALAGEENEGMAVVKPGTKNEIDLNQ
jgi:hypothetical protein